MNQSELNLYQSTMKEVITRFEIITEIVKAIHTNEVLHHDIVMKRIELLEETLRDICVSDSAEAH